MKRTADVALTEHGKTNLNRLRVPEFGVLKLSLNSGGKASKSYLSPDAPAPKAAGKGSDDFHFAPEKETIDIAYEISDPYGAIDQAKLELFCRFREAALWTLDLNKLGVDWFLDGNHTVKWDGRIITPTAAQFGTVDKDGIHNDLTKFAPDPAAHPSFIDGYVTLEHTPYKLRLKVGSNTGLGRGVMAWTYFHILIKDIDLALGSEDIVPKVDDAQLARDKIVRKQIADDGGLSTGNGIRKIYLLSNLFKINSNQMANNTGYQKYRDLWQNGPRIPVLAKIRLADSADNPVNIADGAGAKALGKTKFLWDWEDVAEDTTRHHARAKAFLDDALNFDKVVSQPKGDNCHIELGGKRGPDGKPVFPAQAGYAPKELLDAGKFPFEVKACNVRKWSALSLGWTQGKLKGQTGVVFQPSHIAGDVCKVTVYLANDRRLDPADKKEKLLLDNTDDAPLKTANATKKSTGKFEIWRRLDVIRYYKKKAAVAPNIDLNIVADYYEKAEILIKNVAGAPGSMAKATYNTAIANATAGRPWYEREALSGNDQYDAGLHFIDFLDHAAWVARVNAQFAANGWNNAQQLAWRTGLANTAGNDPYGNPAVYYEFLYNWALSYIERVCGSFMSPDDGINIFHFLNLYNPALPNGTRLNGFAANPPGSGLTKCGFIQCGSNYGGMIAAGVPNLNTREQTCTHEIGHQLFLPHTWQVDPGHDPEGTHDRNDDACTMSYEFAKVRRFCGLCLLRLRGWSKYKTDANGTEAAPAVRTLKDAGANKRP